MTKEEHESMKAPVQPSGLIPMANPHEHRSVRPLAPAPAPAPAPTIGQEIGKRFGVLFGKYRTGQKPLYSYEEERLHVAISRLDGNGLLGGCSLEGCTVTQSCLDRVARSSNMSRGLVISAEYLTPLEGEVKRVTLVTFRISLTWTGLQITLIAGRRRFAGEEALAAYGRFKLMAGAIRDHIRARWDQPY